MSKQHHTDDKLIDMLKSQSKHEYNEALTFIYSKNYNKVESYILKNSGTIVDAEDIFQDGLIAFYEQVVKGSFRGNSAIATYLFAICKNLWYKKLRRAYKKNETYGTEIEITDDGNIVIDTLIKDEETKSLMSLLDKIGESSKQILILYYYEKKKMKEIAEIMNLENQQVAKNKKFRSLKKLRELAAKIPEMENYNL